MNPLLTYFWPVFAAGLACGLIAGVAGFRLKIVRPADRPKEYEFIRPPTRQRHLALIGGIAASIVLAALWHWPLGGADRFTTEVESGARRALNYYEMPKIDAHLHHGPLTRALILSGRADDFQTGELARLLSQLPGVSKAQWTNAGAGPPLVVEAAAVSLLGFLFGLLLAYLVELRRRYNAQWTW
jgi:membrane protease YdiL (CAAX protease family)